MTLKLRDYQEVPVLTTINNILSFKKTVLVGCPGSGYIFDPKFKTKY